MSTSEYSLTSLYEIAPSGHASTVEGGVRFLRLTARAMAAVDETPARIEEGVRELADILGFTADANATATAIFLTLTRGEEQWTEVIRIPLRGPDLARAVALHRLLDRVRRGEMSADEAAERVQQLLTWQGRSSVFPTLAGTTLISASAALLLQASLTEFVLSTIMGFVVGLALIFLRRRPHWEPLVPVALAAVASYLAFSAPAWGFGAVRPLPLLIASLVIFLPGWRLTVAMTELSQGHWTSGSGRFLAAITTLLLLIVGVVVGQQASATTGQLVVVTGGNAPLWAQLLSPVIAGGAMTLLFGARGRDVWWIALMCVITSLAAWLGGRALGSTASAFIGAFTAMAAGVLLGRRLQLPYPVLQQPATVLLVPGSVGFMSMSSLVNQDVNVAIQTGFQMLFIALTLALGAMTAQVAFRPRDTRDPQLLSRRGA
jgi:uncharacterized membrane protein YjjP (DUF1212 family)